MSTFSIDQFATDCLAAMAAADDRQEAAVQLLAQAVTSHGPDAIRDALEAAVPEGASIGEMIVFAHDDLTLLYARAPGRFQSAAHDHTIFACIAQLYGEERSTVYERTDDGLVEIDRQTARVGEVVRLPADAIHAIENPGREVAGALHLYGGDLAGLAEHRTLWDNERKPQPFSFPALVKASVATMHADGNTAGLDAIATAIPAARELVDGLA